MYVILDAFFIARKKKVIELKPYNKWYIYLLIYLAGIFVIVPVEQFLTNIHYGNYRAVTGSMERAILAGDTIILNKWAYTGRTPLRGEVISFLHPAKCTEVLVSRVIGLPGESIKIDDRRVFINNHLLDEPWVFFKKKGSSGVDFLDNMKEFKIPQGCYFYLGDNRDNSSDSRQWGPVNINRIKGKALYVTWSVEPDKVEYMTTTRPSKHFFNFTEVLKNVPKIFKLFFGEISGLFSGRVRWDRISKKIR